MGTLVLFSSYRPELTTTKSLRLCEHCTWYEAFGCENAYSLSEFSVSGKASSSFLVPSKVVSGLLYSNTECLTGWAFYRSRLPMHSVMDKMWNQAFYRMPRQSMECPAGQVFYRMHSLPPIALRISKTSMYAFSLIPKIS